jgi:peptidyl-prolyl cis-trans isomerase SurA
MKNSFFILLFFVFSPLFSGLYQTENVDGLAAVVGSESILKSDVMQQTYMIANQQKIDPFSSPEKFESLYFSVLDQMVNNLVLYDMAKKDTNIVVVDSSVEEGVRVEMERRISIAGSVSALEDMFSEPLSMIRAKLRLEIKKSMKIEFLTSVFYQTTNPSVGDVKAFYGEKKDSLPLLEKRVSFSVFEYPLILSVAKEKKAYDFLSSLRDSFLVYETPFSSLAKNHSDDKGSAVNGGSLGYTSRGTLVQSYEEVAFSLNKEEVSLPFKSPFGYHLVLLEERLGEKIKSSHILRALSFDKKDTEETLKSLSSFLGEQGVYNSVNKFDSLCSHYRVNEKSFQGVYREIPLSSLPVFLEKKLSLSSQGFLEPFVESGSFFVVYFSSFHEESFPSFENNYQNLFNLTRMHLIESKILAVINKHKKKIHFETFY